MANIYKLPADCQVGRNLEMEVEDLTVGSGVRIGNDVSITVNRLCLADGVRVESGSRLHAEVVELGHGTKVGERCMIGEAPEHRIFIGEHVIVGNDAKIIAPAVAIGDYTTIHNHCLLNGSEMLVVGHNCWIGQNCVLNAQERLVIGNNFGLGMYSCIYTHGYFAELLLGGQFFKEAPVEIGDDVWVMGQFTTIGPGATIGDRAVILSGSNVTGNVDAGVTFGGTPAKDLTRFLPAYRAISLEKKCALMHRFVGEFLDARYPDTSCSTDDGFIISTGSGGARFIFQEQVDSGWDHESASYGEVLVFAGRLEGPAPSGITVFDIGRRVYIRTRGRYEVEMIRFLKSYRARFVPADQPHVQLPLKQVGLV